MRIVAGRLRGRVIAPPGWVGLRPTSDRLRETLFNVLAPEIAGARVIDGYAGTGAIGIEALSRGALRVTFVERDPRAVRLIAQNLSRLAVGEGYAIIRAGWREAAPRLRGEAFDLVLLDPPYGPGTAIEALEGAALVAGVSTLVALEHAWREMPPDAVAGLARRRLVRSGDSALSFYRLGAAPAAPVAPVANEGGEGGDGA